MSHLLLLLLLFFSSNACKEEGLQVEEKIDEIPAVATNTWIVPSLQEINSYASDAPQNRTSLSLVKGEYEHFQLVVETEKNETFTIERSEATPNPALSFQCRHMAAYESKEDVLIPCEGSVKPANKVIKLWITYHATEQMSAGEYREIIRLKSASQEIAVSVAIHVENITLPQTPSIASVFGINPNNILKNGLTAKEQEEKRKELSDLLLSYRISPYFSTWLSGSMRTEVNSSPYSWDDQRTLDYISDPRFSRIALPFHGLSDEQLESMLQGIQAKGLTDKVYFYIWDEPTKLAEYEKIKNFAAKVHRYSPQAKVITTFYRGPEDGDRANDLFAVFDILSGSTQVFCTGVWSLQGNEQRSAQCRAKLRSGEEWWTYVCMADKPGLAHNSSAIENRIVLWRSWKEQSTGFLYWVVNGFASMSPLKPRPELPSGDGILLYPGEPFGASVPLVSVRLERWRDGAEDYELLLMMEKKQGRQAAEALLKNVYTTPTKYTTNIKYIETFRKKLMDGLK